MTFQRVPEVVRSVTAPVTTATRREYDPAAVVAELVLRFEVDGLLTTGEPIPDPPGAHDAAQALLKAIGLTPADLGMRQRIAHRVAALAGAR